MATFSRKFLNIANYLPNQFATFSIPPNISPSGDDDFQFLR